MCEDNAPKTYPPLKRQSGILLHPTSLPSPYGIGDMGKEAYRFIDFLHQAGQHLWQVLPLTPTGYGDSPYQSFSAFAGQPLLISPEHLMELNLLTTEDLVDCPNDDPMHIDFGSLIPWKTNILKKAFQKYRLQENTHPQYESFCNDNASWLPDYSLFMALKDAHDGRSWLEWDSAYKHLDQEGKACLREEHQEAVFYYEFIQFLFFQEWYHLKSYANEKDIKIIGDIPIFVSLDSADVWANQHYFQLDENGTPYAVAGVPPDYFSSNGQLWGNPLYDWEVHRAEGYAWWISRIQSQLKMLDYLRIDHFRGFESYWSVPFGDTTAQNGSWKKGPGKDLFRAVAGALGEYLPIIAEDLGIITPEVETLRDYFGFPGMKVLQFGFEDSGESTFLPHQFTTVNCICYTGTHDNDTTVGWYETVHDGAKWKVRQYMKTDGTDISMAFIRTCLGTIARFAIFPLQDVLGIGKEGRMNAPGTPSGNWSWRFQLDAPTDAAAYTLKELSHLYGRY